MAFSTVFTQILILFMIMAAGFAAGKAKVFSEKASKDLSALLIRVATPALVIVSMLREYDSRLMIDALLTLAVTFSAFGVAIILNLLLSKVLKVKNSRRGIWVLTTTFTNSGFMGFPVALALFGREGLFLAAFANLAQNLLMFSVGVRLVVRDNPDKDHQAEPFLKTMLSPVNISLVIGLVLFFLQIPVPEPATDALEKIAGIVTPVSMIVVGLNISKYRPLDVLKDRDAILAAVLHALLIPFILLLTLKLIPFREGSIVPAVSVLILSMPVSSISQALAEQYGSDSTFTSHAIFIGNLICLGVCPLIMTLI
ncbi:MAG: AEC family transporter [Lachnospiraceae bacterium]|nr:AEC family transporter [Lachnospiraceae bacterium]MBR6271451.1 AEC family transporter [Lachnospiraceae bacterium]